MIKNLILCFFLFLTSVLNSKEYKVEGFVFDFDDGWSEIKGADPNSVLRLEKSGSYLEFIKLEDELSDFYLNSRLNEQREILLNKGLKPTDIRTQTIHLVSKIYYFYYDDKKLNIVGLFTYGGITYNFISYGITDDSFKKLIYGFRKEGEKIEFQLPKPKPKPKPKPLAKIEEQENSYLGVSFISVSDSTTSVSETTSALTAPASYQISISTKEPEILVASSPSVISETYMPKPDIKRTIYLINSFIDELFKKSDTRPFIERKNLNKYITVSLIISYFMLILIFKTRFSRYLNPKIKPYPKEMPPDFLFPFIITRVDTTVETMYQIITRNNQFLSAHFNHSYKKFYGVGVWGVILIHALWSLGDFVREGFFQAVVVAMPLGNYIISFIELPFLALIVYAMILKLKEKQKVSISDSQMNLLCEVIGEKKAFVVKDGKGKDVLKIKKFGTYFKRKWDVINEDEQLVMTIKDDYPDIWLWTKILGNKFFDTRCYYSIYVENDKRIGFLFLDPNSSNGYQVHFDYDYFRLSNPVFTISILLYIISKEKEESILFI